MDSCAGYACGCRCLMQSSDASGRRGEPRFSDYDHARRAASSGSVADAREENPSATQPRRPGSCGDTTPLARTRK
jgi:hypothetical protein